MIFDSGTILVHLGHRELLCVEVGRGLSVRCLEASVWITQHGGCEDLVVESGRSMTLARPGLAVIQALKAGRVCLRTLAEPACSETYPIWGICSRL